MKIKNSEEHSKRIVDHRIFRVEIEERYGFLWLNKKSSIWDVFYRDDNPDTLYSTAGIPLPAKYSAEIIDHLERKGLL